MVQKQNIQSQDTSETDLTAFTRTSDAIDKAQASFSNKLAELYKAREKAREKRQRTAERQALGHALSDLFGAIGAHYVSGQDNSMAIVPQSLAPKSYAKVQSLIDEGVADAKTFDQYMLSLTQKKGEQSVSMAQAQDKAAVDLSIQARKEADAEKDRQFKAQRDKERMAFDKEQNELDRENNLLAREITAGAKGETTGKKELENWQRVAAVAFYDSSRTSTADTVDNVTGMSTTTKTEYQASPSNNDLANAYAQAENFANQLGITLNQQNVNDIVALKKLIGKKYITQQGQEITVDTPSLKTYLANGFAKEYQLSALVQQLKNSVN